MATDWGEKLFDTVMGGLPMVAKAVPRHLQQRARARLNEVNPFARISANEDLRRALRLAWVEAALQLDAAAVQACGLPEWAAQADDVPRFSAVLCPALRRLRAEAFDRDVPPRPAPMDAHLQALVAHVPGTMLGHLDGAGQGLTDGFNAAVAALAGWPLAELPGLYPLLARQGLPLPGTDEHRTFGDLVYAVFADTLNSPDRYPEARHAFVIAIGGLGVDLARECLALLREQDAQIDRLLDAMGDLAGHPAGAGGLAGWLARADAEGAARWQALSSQVARVGADLNEKLDQQSRQLHQLVAVLQARGHVGDGPQQLAHDTVLALARRLRPDDLIDLDSALAELDAAVTVALDLIAKGHSSHYQDRFVDAVLQQVSRSIEAGQLEQGAQSLDDALAELDRREHLARAAARQQREQLLQASIEQALLLRDPQRAADAVQRLVALDHSLRPASSDPFLRRLRAFLDDGNQRGLRLPLQVAEALARKRLADCTGAHERADARVWLGIALWTLGERESGTERLEQAVQAYRDALQEITRERVPLNWAKAQNNLGNALQTLGERESGTERLEQAVQAYSDALQERTRERVPLDWAKTQNNLGIALGTLGERESGTERLEQAVQAFRDALQEYTRERVPLNWATTQNNLGTALRTLGERESGTERLEQAVQAFRDALQERTRERVPLDWAKTQNNLGNALRTLGERESGTERLEQAVQAYRDALQEYTRERVPLNWATTQNNLGTALRTLGERESGTERLEQAVQAFRDALQERTRERVPLDWATTQNNLGNALQTLGERESGTEQLEQAVQAYRDALQEITRETHPHHFGVIQRNLNRAQDLIRQRTSAS